MLKEISEVVREQKQLRREKLVDVYKTVVAIASVMVSVLASLPPPSEAPITVIRLYQGSLSITLLSALLGFLALWGEALFHERAISNIGKQLEEKSVDQVYRSLSTEMIYPHWFFSWCNRLTPVVFCLSLVTLSSYAIYQSS